MTEAFSRAQLLAMLGSAAITARPMIASAQTDPLRFGAAGSESFDEAFLLVDGGFLSRAGLAGDAELLTNGPRITEAILGGSMEIGMSDILQLANAVNHGFPLAFFAGGSVYNTDAPTTVLCVASNGPIRTPKDLEGKIIGLQGLKTLAEVSTREWLRTHDVDPEKVSFIEIGPALAVPTLLRGTVDAAVISEPFVSAGGDDIRRFGKPYDTVAKQFYISAFYAKRDWLVKNDAIGRKLQRAIYATARWTNTHHDESAVLLSKRLKMEPDRLKKMTRATFATVLDPKLMQPVLTIATKYGLLEKPVDASTLIALG
jgi:NitT/TauT family transport system substrate-binding protein